MNQIFVGIGIGYLGNAATGVISVLRDLFLIVLSLIVPIFLGVTGIFWAAPAADILAIVTTVVVMAKLWKELSFLQGSISQLKNREAAAQFLLYFKHVIQMACLLWYNDSADAEFKPAYAVLPSLRDALYMAIHGLKIKCPLCGRLIFCAHGIIHSRIQPLRVCRALRSKILSLPCQVKSNEIHMD